MDYRRLNRAQFFLNLGSRLEKTSGAREAGGAMWEAVKSVAHAGHKGMKGAVGHLKETGHPILAATLAAAPVAGGVAAEEKLRQKARVQLALRRARQQGFIQ